MLAQIQSFQGIVAVSVSTNGYTWLNISQKKSKLMEGYVFSAVT